VTQLVLADPLRGGRPASSLTPDERDKLFYTEHCKVSGVSGARRPKR